MTDRPSRPGPGTPDTTGPDTPHPSAEPDRLRARLDRGEGSDKINFPDPAAAPLGTDDEAGGHPVTPEQAEMALRAETRGAPERREMTTAPRQQVPGNWVFAAGLTVAGLVLIFGVAALI